jgi:hypothetical protein
LRAAWHGGPRGEAAAAGAWHPAPTEAPRLRPGCA